MFQLSAKFNTARAASPCLQLGRHTYHKAAKDLAPSSFADSNRLRGTAYITCRIKNTPNAENIPGSINAAKVPFMFNASTMIKLGTRVTCKGIIMIKTITKNRMLLPGKRKRANAYPPNTATTNCPIRIDPLMNIDDQKRIK